MAHKDWSQAYFTILTLSLVLLLPCSVISALFLGEELEQMCRDMRLQLPRLSELYFSLGPWRSLWLCGGGLVVILALAVRRDRLYAAVAAGAVFAACMLFLLYASLALILPFVSLSKQLGQP